MHITEDIAGLAQGAGEIARPPQEAPMKKLYLLAALLMTSTAAPAGNSISLEINGHRVHIAAPSNCDSLSCIQISAPGLSASDFGFKGIKFGSNRADDDDGAAPRKDTSAPVDQPAAAPVAPAISAPPASTAVASTSPAPAPRYDAPAAAAPSAAAPAASPAVPVTAAPVAAPTTPLGVWATEENKGNIRVEPCGQDLCGYAEKSGEKILINMKPSNAKWVGRIHDPDSGNDYDSTIAMKGPNSMRVQGCAFGGMFCGGQTWKRVS
jgi:uncharacterized protein (DUF2147 family)